MPIRNRRWPFYRAALAFRRAHPALIEGDIELFKANEPVLAFRRSAAGESLVCIYNLSPTSVKVTLRGEGEMLLSQAAERRKDRLTLGPNGYALIAEGAAPLHVEFRTRRKAPARTSLSR